MALTDILEKIETETELKITEINSDFEKKKIALEKTFQDKKSNLEKSINQSIEEKAERIMEKAKNLSFRENQNELVNEKRKLIDECLDEAIEKLSKSDNYEEIIKKLLKKIPYEKGEIISAKGKEEATKKALQSSGKTFELSKETISVKGGFLFKSEKIEIDFSFETMIKRQLKESLEIKLNKLLFK